jgi:hypothetical protein
MKELLLLIEKKYFIILYKLNIYLEILSLLPLDIFVLFYGMGFIGVLRFLKLIRLRKLPTYGGLVESIVRETTGIVLSFEFRRLIMMYFALFQVIIQCNIVL